MKFLNSNSPSAIQPKFGIGPASPSVKLSCRRGSVATLAGAMGTFGAIAVILTCGGCTGSAQEEYYRIRGIVVSPQPGDGATLTAIDPSSSRGIAGSAPAIALGHAPRTASDQPSAAE